MQLQSHTYTYIKYIKTLNYLSNHKLQNKDRTIQSEESIVKILA